MGTSHPRRMGLADALFTTVQQRVLALLFGQPGRSFQSAEIIRLARSGTGAAHRFLGRLADVGLVTVTTAGNQKHYQANPDSPIFSELRGLVTKTVGLAEPLRRALKPLARRIHAAFIYGSLAKGTDKASSDLDLMVVSDTLDHPTVYDAIGPAESILQRPINPTVMTKADWKKRLKTDSFVARVASQPRLFIVGSADELD